MRIAIIDLGTNSVRFDVVQLGPRGQAKRVHREKIMVRLGQGVFLRGKLDRNAIRRTLQAFLKFRRLAKNFGVRRTVAFATSAIREVAHREPFLELIRKRTGIEVRVISGPEEAQLIALGVLTHEKPRKGTFALVDIGGGSTEISLCRGRKVLRSASFPIGTARVQQVFLKTSPPKPADVGLLREYLRITLYGVMLAERWPAVSRVVGSSGTIRALAKIMEERTGKPAILRDDLVRLIEKMRLMKAREIVEIDGMDAKRADMILGGAIVLQECVDALGASRVDPTEFSLRDGILEEELRLYREGSGTHLALHLPDILEKAALFGQSERHLRKLEGLAEQVFDQLAGVHKLKPLWKPYLIAAALMRESGEAINPAMHGEHSYYIVKNAQFPGAEGWETEWIARLCRYHDQPKLERMDLGFTKNKAKRQIFLKLLALLKVVDALDRGPESSVVLRRPKITRTRVFLRYSGRGVTGLESLELEKRAEFLREALGRVVVGLGHAS